MKHFLKFNFKKLTDFLFKKIQLPFLPVVFTVLMLPSFTFSQLVDQTIRGNQKEFFYFDPMIFYSSDEFKPRLDAYIEIPLENLQFKKNYNTKLYDASINYTIKITNSTNEVVVNESISDYVSTNKDMQKNLDESAKYIVKEYYLNPGNYKIEVSLTDINTKKDKVINKNLSVNDYSRKDVSFSDIMLVSKLKQENGKKVITPLVDKNIDNIKDLFLFFEIYNSKNENLTNIFSYKVTDNKNNIIEKGDFTYTLIPGINKHFEKVQTKNMIYGDYKLEISDKINGEILASKDFFNRMIGIPVNLKNLDLLIDQMIYIASSDDINKIRRSAAGDERQKSFIEFWKSKDPSPGTSRNELMIEYYKRINTANERYSHYIDGWKTDMGMVYIIFGEPNNIERYPFTENTKPYEIWDFYSLNKQFIFVDESGFGDYKLTNPIWDEERTKIRF